jgi:hypothetical protein
MSEVVRLIFVTLYLSVCCSDKHTKSPLEPTGSEES